MIVSSRVSSNVRHMYSQSGTFDSGNSDQPYRPRSFSDLANTFTRCFIAHKNFTTYSSCFNECHSLIVLRDHFILPELGPYASSNIIRSTHDSALSSHTRPMATKCHIHTRLISLDVIIKTEHYISQY